MIKLATIDDFMFIRSVATHPDVYNDMADDHSVEAKDFSPVPFLTSFPVAFTVSDFNGIVFFLHMHNSSTVVVHTCILPFYRGKYGRIIAKEGIDYIFSETQFTKIVTYIPKFNRKALVFAKLCGMKIEGMLSKSFLKNGILHDEYILGINKEG